VFSAVWLLPLAFVWIDIELILNWLSEIKTACLLDDINTNIALSLAFTQYYYYTKEKKNICVFFPYSSRLGQIWEWYKQLLAESIWKDWIGITPCSAIGVTDQHSQLQLYQDGPRDKLFISLEISHSKNELWIDYNNNLTFDRLLKIEKFGTESSLRNEGIPVIALSMEKIDERNIAQLLYILEFQVAYLWELFEINAFDQPWVEKSKIITKQKLQIDFPELDLMREAFWW
jgi:glucose-6-phosphate isomerase